MAAPPAGGWRPTTMAMVLLLAASPPLVAGGSCPISCFCFAGEEVSCNINGTEVTVAYKPGEYAYLTCDNVTQSGDYWRYLPSLGGELRAATALGVRDCPPPDGSYADVAAALGLPPAGLADLTVRAAPAGRGLARHHLARLPALAKLTLADDPGFAVAADLTSAAPSLTELRVAGVRATLPMDAAPALRTLELSGADMRTLPSDAFGRLSGLRRLLLWGSNVSALEEGALDGLTELDTLDLSSNLLSELPPNLFREARLLRALSLASNELRALPPGLLEGLSALEEVRLHDNRAALALSPRQFANLSRLIVLELSRSGLTSLPEGALDGARSLRELSLAGNALEELEPRELRDLESLRALDLSDNRIARLSPGHFSGLIALRTLTLDGNQISELPDGVLGGLRSLEVLRAERAGVRAVRGAALAGAGSLREVRLSHNELDDAGVTRGGVSAFAGSLRLRRLELAHNRLTWLPDDWRLVLLELDTLLLAHNRIGDLQFADINFLSENVTVDLSHNNISRVDLAGADVLRVAGADSGTAGGATVLLEGNPLLCDCGLYPLRAGAGAGAGAGGPRLVLGDAECAGPERARGRRAADLSPDELWCSTGDGDEEGEGECPSSCECSWWPARGVLRLRCARWPATWPPGAAGGGGGRGRRLALSLEGGGGGGGGEFRLERDAPPELTEVDLGPSSPSPDEGTLRRLLDHNRTLVLDRARLPCACRHRRALLRLLAASPASPAAPAANLRCVGGGTVRDALDAFCPPPEVVAGSAAALALLVAVLLVGVAGWRRRRAACARARARPDADPDDEEMEYDVFVSHAHEDEPVVAGSLAPGLEARGWRLCLHFRDWAVGEPIPEQISRSVRRSRRTLLVVSPAFLRSCWARAEWREARAGGRALVVLLDVGAGGVGGDEPPPELREYLRGHTYVKWGDPWFWDKLSRVLPPPVGARPAPAPRAPLHRRLWFSDRLWWGGRLTDNVLRAAETDVKPHK